MFADAMRTAFMMMIAGLFAGMLVACEEQGPAEQAGEAVDNAAEQAGEILEQAGEAAEDATSN